MGWTLVDETRAHLDRFEQVRRAAPGAAGKTARNLLALYEAAFTAWAPDALVDLLEQVGLSAGDRKRFTFDPGVTRPYRDAAPALRALKGVVRLGVLANQSPGVAQRLANWGLGSFFDLILGSSELGMSKPDPRFFALAAERAGVQADSILMAGDRLDNDIAPAKRAGWGTVWVRRGVHAGQEPRSEDERADHVVTTLTRLAALFVPPDRLRLAELLDAGGAIMAWPEKTSEKKLVLSYLAGRFEHGREYVEREVNALIEAHHRFGDYALLRRELVDRGYLSRDDAGHRYRRTVATVAS